MNSEHKEAKQQWTIKYSSIEVAGQVIEYSDVTMNNKVEWEFVESKVFVFETKMAITRSEAVHGLFFYKR